MNFKFFGMQPLPTFACHDVMKNAEVEEDLKRFEAHLKKHFEIVMYSLSQIKKIYWFFHE